MLYIHITCTVACMAYFEPGDTPLQRTTVDQPIAVTQDKLDPAAAGTSILYILVANNN